MGIWMLYSAKEEITIAKRKNCKLIPAGIHFAALSFGQ
jgi:hypothetical protein